MITIKMMKYLTELGKSRLQTQIYKSVCINLPHILYKSILSNLKESIYNTMQRMHLHRNSVEKT